MSAYSTNSQIAFAPEQIFETLYKDVFPNVYKERVIAFEGCKDVALRGGFIDTTRKHLQGYFELLMRSSMSSADVHRRNLAQFKDHWRQIKNSSSTCLGCLRRRPQYGLHCGHIVCENCVLIFADVDENDPWVYQIHHCFLCGEEMPEKVSIRTHPPTAGVGVLCLDGGGARGAATLSMMKRIQERIGLPIPFQKFFKVAFGISSGNVLPATVELRLQFQEA